MANRRIKKELKELEKDNIESFTSSIVNNDIFHWIAILKGPKDSPYQGGIFKINIKIPRLSF